MGVTSSSSLEIGRKLQTDVEADVEADKNPGLLQGTNPDYAHSHQFKKPGLSSSRLYEWTNKSNYLSWCPSSPFHTLLDIFGLSKLNYELICVLLTFVFSTQYIEWGLFYHYLTDTV